MEVTERGVLVAMLVPPGRSRNARELLIAEGRLIAGSGTLRLPTRVQAQRSTESVLADLREDE